MRVWIEMKRLLLLEDDSSMILQDSRWKDMLIMSVVNARNLIMEEKPDVMSKQEEQDLMMRMKREQRQLSTMITMTMIQMNWFVEAALMSLELKCVLNMGLISWNISVDTVVQSLSTFVSEQLTFVILVMMTLEE